MARSLVSFRHKGDFAGAERLFGAAARADLRGIMARYGKEGAAALAAATPKDTGETAASWDYEIAIGRRSASLKWTNGNATAKGVPVAILLQYGHATGSGGYVQGTDYINPALRPIFDRLAEELWREVAG